MFYTGAMFDYSGLQSKTLKDFLRKIVSGTDYSCTQGFFDDSTLKKYNASPVYAIANPIDICERSIPLQLDRTKTGSLTEAKL